ncbi:MAG TPA: hypothetical protein DDW86_00775 [Clostridiales bacterium]|nr:hypothetical protein [Clostridiales bacterium]
MEQDFFRLLLYSNCTGYTIQSWLQIISKYLKRLTFRSGDVMMKKKIPGHPIMDGAYCFYERHNHIPS